MNNEIDVINEIQVEKSRVQAEAVRALESAQGRGLVAMATGSGKSKVAIDYVGSLNCHSEGLLVVPTEKLRDRDWELEFIEWDSVDNYNKMMRACYASIKNIQNTHFKFVILDEVQFVTELNSVFFFENGNTFDKIICLSATPPHEKEKTEILEGLGIEVVYHLPLDEAVELGIVAPYKLTIVGVQLNDTVKYVPAGNKKNPFYTTEKKHYEYLTKKLDEAVKTGQRHERLKFMRLARMRFIYNLRSKELAAKYMLRTVIPQDERTLIFAGSIKVAESLESNSFHSKTSDVHFNAFVQEDINRLSAVQALNVGVNIPNLDNALIQQVQSKERHLIQKIGRIVRWRPDHEANIYLMYAIGTVDEDWLYAATQNIDKSNINIIKLKTQMV